MLQWNIFLYEMSPDYRWITIVYCVVCQFVLCFSKDLDYSSKLDVAPFLEDAASPRFGYNNNNNGYNQVFIYHPPVTGEEIPGDMHGHHGGGTSINHDDQSQHWGYDPHDGPHTWCPRFPMCCGYFQSPINIHRCNAKSVSGLPLRFRHYDCTPDSMKLLNNGHTVMLQAGYLSKRPWIEGGGLADRYVLDSIHFHWGAASNFGSEHQFDSMPYPLEMHMVHFVQSASNLIGASNIRFGIAVVAVLFHLSPTDNINLVPLIEPLQHIEFRNDFVDMPVRFELFNLLPVQTTCFYRYVGSLTTPNCTEPVIWTVMGDTVPISERQVQAFRNLFHDERNSGTRHEHIANNFRPVQPLNSRVVYKYGCYPDYCSSYENNGAKTALPPFPSYVVSTNVALSRSGTPTDITDHRYPGYTEDDDVAPWQQSQRITGEDFTNLRSQRITGEDFTNLRSQRITGEDFTNLRSPRITREDSEYLWPNIISNLDDRNYMSDRVTGRYNPGIR